MPKKPIDYKKSIIYSITCNSDASLNYIGSTTEYTKRKASHKKCCNLETDKDHNRFVYITIRENGGWENWTMKPIKEYPCETKIQLLIEEERIRKEMHATLNKQRCITTRDEYNEDQRKRMNTPEMKEWRKNYSKQYYEENKEDFLAKRKLYLEANKERDLICRKAYYEKNKEAIALKKKIRYEANKIK